MFVAVQPPIQRLAPLGLGSVRAGVGPLLVQDPVETLHLVVGLGPVSAGALVLDLLVRE